EDVHSLPHLTVLIDPLADGRAGGALDLIERIERFLDLDVDPILQESSDVRLRGEVAVERRGRGARGSGDVCDAGGAIALFDEQLNRRVDEALFGQLPKLAAQRNHFRALRALCLLFLAETRSSCIAHQLFLWREDQLHAFTW